MKILRLLLLVVLCWSLQAIAQCTSNPPTQPSNTFPLSTINGTLVYHAYVSDGDGSSQLWTLNFSTGVLTNISSSWACLSVCFLQDPMNAQFSPDGNWLLFMAIQNNAWNVFVWPTNGSHLPYNLTNSTGATRNEDPKWAADGNSIVWKQNSANDWSAPFSVSGGVPSIGTATNVTNNATQNSMPFWDNTSANLYFATGTGSNLKVVVRNISTGTQTQISAKGYYPVVRWSDNTVFWSDDTATGALDQIHYKLGGTGTNTTALLNDCNSNNSDAWPVNSTTYVFFSGTQPGNYQLYLGDLSTGNRWSLTPFGVNSNTGLSYLGPAYMPGSNSPTLSGTLCLLFGPRVGNLWEMRARSSPFST